MMLHDTSLENPSRNKQVSLTLGENPKLFIQAHVAKTGIKSNQVDVIYETYGVLGTGGRC